jgi:hypothetical protein
MGLRNQDFAIRIWPMPSLLRLLTIAAIIGALVYAGLYSLAHFVEPSTRQMSVFIPPDKLLKKE